jgi:hypothetical protein
MWAEELGRFDMLFGAPLAVQKRDGNPVVGRALPPAGSSSSRGGGRVRPGGKHMVERFPECRPGETPTRASKEIVGERRLRTPSGTLSTRALRKGRRTNQFCADLSVGGALGGSLRRYADFLQMGRHPCSPTLRGGTMPSGGEGLFPEAINQRSGAKGTAVRRRSDRRGSRAGI